jgi:hypothetical protein
VPLGRDLPVTCFSALVSALGENKDPIEISLSYNKRRLIFTRECLFLECFRGNLPHITRVGDVNLILQPRSYSQYHRGGGRGVYGRSDFVLFLCFALRVTCFVRTEALAVINGYKLNCLDVPVSKLNKSKRKNNLTQYFSSNCISNGYRSQDSVFWN